jgi:hypothetical protein
LQIVKVRAIGTMVARVEQQKASFGVAGGKFLEI